MALRAEAQAYGPATQQVIDDLLTERPMDRLRTAQAILRLGPRVGTSRLEAACRRALWFGDPRYHTLKAILHQGLDHEPLPEAQQAAPLPKTAAFARSVTELRPAALSQKGVSHG